jgi:hypothetical protein
MRQALVAHLGLGEPRRRRLSFIGIGSSGHTDTSDRFEEILAQEWAADIERHRDP